MFFEELPSHYRYLCGEVSEDDERELYNQLFLLGIDVPAEWRDVPRFSKRANRSKLDLAKQTARIQAACFSMLVTRPILDDFAEEEVVETLMDRLYDQPDRDTEYSLAPDWFDEDRSLERVMVSELEQVFRKLLTDLHPREEAVIRLRFGIGHREDYALEDAARIFGVTRERVRQIETKALRKLCEKRPVRILELCFHGETAISRSEVNSVRKPNHSEEDWVEIPESAFREQIQLPVPGTIKPSVETKVRNACLLSDEEELLLSHVFGWFGQSAVPLSEYAKKRFLTDGEQRSLSERVAKSVKRLQQMSVWKEVQIPTAWKWREAVTIPEITAVPIDIHREIPRHKSHLEYLFDLTQGKPFSIAMLQAAHVRKDWPFKHGSGLSSILGHSGLYSQGYWFRRHGTRGSFIYEWTGQDVFERQERKRLNGHRKTFL